VPKGMKEMMTNIKAILKEMLLLKNAKAIKSINQTNNTPCAMPMYFTPSGIPKEYLSGIAIINNKR
jgi:hypothetical protein